MRIFNVMMSRDLGGIQQAFLDYSKALTLQNHQVINITSFNARINYFILNSYRLLNLGSWCIISKLIFRILILFYKPDIIICHGNRAINFAIFFKNRKIPIIGVAHNYSVKHLKKCDHILTLTNKLNQHLSLSNIDSQKIHMLPNMINITHKYSSREFNSPIIIGSIGRFVEKKGFIHLIEAISILKNKNYNIKLHLGGDGIEKDILKNKAIELNINQDVIFQGWVDDKAQFFKDIDIFCLPSLDEPFGIILLEAMLFSKPIIATNSGGPQEIIQDKQDGLIVNIDVSTKYINLSNNIAITIEKLINEPQLAKNLSQNAYIKLNKNYDISIISQKLTTILENIIK